MTAVAKILAGCHCCTGERQHCPNCHSVAMHGVTSFAYVTVAMGLPVYWGSDQAAADDAARAGAGYVIAMPILADYRHLTDDDRFRPVLATAFGNAAVPLEQVRTERHDDGATWRPRHAPYPPATPQSHGLAVEDLTMVRGKPREHTETVPGSTESVQHAGGWPDVPPAVPGRVQ